MSDALKPQLHGRDHRPGGRDPIPTSLPEIPWARRSRGYDATAFGTGSGTEIAVEYNHDYNMGSGDSGENYFASVGASSIQILKDGLYLITGEIIWTANHNFNYAVGLADAISDTNHYSQGANLGSDIQFSQFTIMRRYTASDNPFVKIVVIQTSGSGQSIDAAYLEVAYLGSWTGTSFLDMDPPQ